MVIALSGILSITIIAVALIVAAVIITKKQMLAEKKMPLKITDRDVMYLCDKSMCPDARQCGECIHTTNVEHAANFRKEMWGSSCVYVEQSKDERVL